MLASLCFQSGSTGSSCGSMPELFGRDTSVLEGSFDKDGLPDNWADFVGRLKDFLQGQSLGMLFDSRVYSKVLRKSNEVAFCGIDGVVRTRYYRCGDEICEGDTVVVPTPMKHTLAINSVLSQRPDSERDGAGTRDSGPCQRNRIGKRKKRGFWSSSSFLIALFTQNLSERKHCVADTFWAGTQNLAGLNAFQVLADGSTAFTLEILYKLFGNTGRAFAICENACHHDSANQGPAGAFHTAHPGSISRSQLHQGLLINRELVLEHFHHSLSAIAFSGCFQFSRSRCAFFDTRISHSFFSFHYTTKEQMLRTSIPAMSTIQPVVVYLIGLPNSILFAHIATYGCICYTNNNR